MASVRIELVKRLVKLRNDVVDARAKGHIEYKEYRIAVAALNQAKAALVAGTDRSPETLATLDQINELAKEINRGIEHND